MLAYSFLLILSAFILIATIANDTTIQRKYSYFRVKYS